MTVLRSDQYRGLESFTEVGAFVPLVSDRQGTVLREVAPARFALPLPDQPGQTLSLSVALVRDLRRQMPVVAAQDVVPEVHRWYSDLDLDARNEWRAGVDADASTCHADSSQTHSHCEHHLNL